MQDLFLSLPTALSGRIVSEWLIFKGLEKLDGAYEKKTEWHDLLQSMEVTLPIGSAGRCSKPLPYFWKWCTARKVHVGEIYCNGRNDHYGSSAFADFVQACCSEKTTHLHIEAWNQPFGSLLAIVGLTCFKLRSIYIGHCGSLEGLTFLLQRSQATLQSLRIYRARKEGLESLEELSLPALTELHVTEMEEEDEEEETEDEEEGEEGERGGGGGSASLATLLVAASPCLRKVRFQESGVNTKTVKALGNSGKHLRVAIFDNCRITDTDLALLASVCPQLESVALIDVFGSLEDTGEGDTNLTDEGILALTAQCQHLHTLIVSDAEARFTGKTLQHIAASCGVQLLHLSLRGMDCGISSVGTLALARCCPNIRSLSWAIGGVPDEALLTLLSSLSQLRELEGCRFSDRLVRSAVDHCLQLSFLCVDDVGSPLTPAGLHYAMEHGAALRELVLTVRRNLKHVTSAVWKKRRPQLRAHYSDITCPSLALDTL